MKTLARLITLSLALIPFTCEAQMPAPSPLPSVPTTKILAIGRLNVPRSPEILKLLSSKEAPDTVRLYLAGKIDQWYSLKDGNGVVFILNLSSVEEAHSMLEGLPFGQAKVMTFELIPLGPLAPLSLLLPHPDNPAQ
ncbi:MAG TPA: hypothetical protein VK684_03055 [Edaphobacter sp.]|nr:hypothetical protein [Edaphobacter sp.]